MSEDITSPPRQEHRRENQTSIRDIPQFPTMAGSASASTDPNTMIKLLTDQNRILLAILEQQRLQKDIITQGFERSSEQNREMLLEMKEELPGTSEDAKELCEKRLPNDVKKQIQSVFGDMKKEFSKFLKYKEMMDKIA